MIFRVYLRDAQQRVTDKIVTGSPAAAIAAFGDLTDRADLDGQRLLAILSRDGAPVAYHDFSKPAPPDPGSNPARWWRGRTPELAGSAQ